MSVTVRLAPGASHLLDGRREATADGATVGEVLQRLEVLERMCDGAGTLRRHLSIGINNSADIRFTQGLDTAVKDGDTITILSALSGG